MAAPTRSPPPDCTLQPTVAFRGHCQRWACCSAMSEVRHHGTTPSRLGRLPNTPRRIDRRTEACLTCWSREPSRPRGGAIPGFRGPAARIPRRAAGPPPRPPAGRHLDCPRGKSPLDLSGHRRPTVASRTREASPGTGEHPGGPLCCAAPQITGARRTPSSGRRRWGSAKRLLVRRDQRTGRTCIPPAALGRIWTPTPPSPTSTPASTSRAFALADVRGPPRGAMGRGGGHPGRPGPAMTQDGPPSVHVSARPLGALSPNGWHRAEWRARSRGQIRLVRR